MQCSWCVKSAIFTQAWMYLSLQNKELPFIKASLVFSVVSAGPSILWARERDPTEPRLPPVWPGQCAPREVAEEEKYVQSQGEVK